MPTAAATMAGKETAGRQNQAPPRGERDGPPASASAAVATRRGSVPENPHARTHGMIRGDGQGYPALPSSRSREAASGRMDDVERRSRRVKIAPDDSRIFPLFGAVFPLFRYDGVGCHRLARTADRAVLIELIRFLAVTDSFSELCSWQPAVPQTRALRHPHTQLGPSVATRRNAVLGACIPPRCQIQYAATHRLRCQTTASSPNEEGGGSLAIQGSTPAVCGASGPVALLCPSSLPAAPAPRYPSRRRPESH